MFISPLDELDLRDDWYSSRGTKSHEGMDFACAIGTPVMAISDGIVIQASFNDTAGNHIIVQHIGRHLGSFSRYLHLDKRLVKKDEKIRAGDIIGLSGHTGTSSSPHLHLDISLSKDLIPIFKEIGLKKSGQINPGAKKSIRVPVEQFIPRVNKSAKREWPLLDMDS